MNIEQIEQQELFNFTVKIQRHLSEEDFLKEYSDKTIYRKDYQWRYTLCIAPVKNLNNLPQFPPNGTRVFVESEGKEYIWIVNKWYEFSSENN